MWLDELVDVIRVLRDRAETHGRALRQNETRTRYALIDPFLAALGWNVNDPAAVTPEFTTVEGRPDYALLPSNNEGKPLAFVEAKRLGTPLQDRLNQVITYCVENGVEYCVVTDGMEWAAYDVFKRVPNSEKLITRFSLMMPDHEVAMKALWLWRGNLVEGMPVVPPVRSLASGAVASVPPIDQWAAESASELKDHWTDLNQVKPKLSAPPPSAMRFPDGFVAQTERWFQLQTRSVEWLISTGRLGPADCPVTTDRGTHLVHREPTRKNGTNFIQPKQAGNLWVEIGYSAPNHARMARNILQARDVDPSSVHVQFSSADKSARG